MQPNSYMYVPGTRDRLRACAREGQHSASAWPTTSLQRVGRAGRGQSVRGRRKVRCGDEVSLLLSGPAGFQSVLEVLVVSRTREGCFMNLRSIERVASGFRKHSLDVVGGEFDGKLVDSVARS